MSSTSSRRIAALSLAFVLLVVGCGKKDVLKGSVVGDAGPCSPSQITPNVSQAPTAPPKPASIPKALVQKDLVVGKGCPATAGSYVKVAYISELAATGATFDSSWATNVPLDFQLGSGQVIPGWEQGLLGMKVGGRRLLVVPASLGYGKAGLPPKVGPDAPLQFVVDLLGVFDTPKCKQPTTSATKPKGEPVVNLPERGPTELATKDLTVGSGPAAVTGSYVRLRFVGVVCRSGELAESSWTTGPAPVTVAVGSGRIVPGWDQGLLGVKAGGQRQIDVPAALAYGATGKVPTVLPNDTVSYVVDIVSVSNTLTCAPATGVPPVPGKPSVVMPHDAPKKLATKDLLVGTGKAATKTSSIVVRYVGIACSTGKQFDSSWDKGNKPFPVTLGQGQVIPGWDQGLVGVKPGGRRQLDIPAALAYGAQGQGSIGPNEPLTFVIDVVSVDGVSAPGGTTSTPTTKKP